ncbi:MAG: hypothetical protein ABRQ23_07020 [Syntrophomonadaceae bacterium]
MGRKKYTLLALTMFVWVALMSSVCLAAPADEGVVGTLLTGNKAEVTMDMNVDTTIYSPQYRDYFWMKNEASSINYTCTAADGGQKSGNTEALLVDCRFYFPMEWISSNLGEDIAWDGSLHRCYVVRDENRTYMSTITLGETHFVKIRDFECLDYQIEYLGQGKQAAINIVKP